MVAHHSRRRFRTFVTTMFLLYLSVAIMSAFPSVQFNQSANITRSESMQSSDGSSELLAATNSLQSGTAPQALASLHCTLSGTVFANCASNLPEAPAALTTTPSNTGWTRLGPTSPSLRAFASLVYDSADGYVILFGGVSGSNNALSETWKFVGGVWTQINSATSPPARFIQSMTYDSADGYVLLFGGFANPGPLAQTLHDTWKFSNGAWTNITGVSGPPARAGASIAYDARSGDGYVVMFGGLPAFPTSMNSIGAALKDTWKFSGGTWTNITTSSGPPARAGSYIEYDTSDGYLLLYGGADQTSLLSDTWTFSGGSWSSLSLTTNPGPRALGAMAYDSLTTDNYLVLFGGDSILTGSNLGAPLKDTWKFSSGSWTNITATSGPSAQFGSTLTFDAKDGYVFLFSLDDSSWKFASGTWTVLSTSSIPGPSPRVGASMAYDVADGYVVLFGGASDAGSTPTCYGDTWQFLGGAWTNITVPGPSADCYPTMTYDTSDGYLLLLTNGNTWKFQGGTWTTISTTSSPPPRALADMTYDAADGYVLLYGGCCKNISTRVGFSDTWEYQAGVWTNITTTTGPGPRVLSGIAYDAVDGYAVLFGGIKILPVSFPFTGSMGDTWKFVGGSWTNITTSFGPTPRIYPYMTWDAGDSYILLFGGVNGSTGFLGDTWRFLAGAWFFASVTSTPSPRSNGVITYDTADGYAVLFGGTQSSVGLSETWTWSQQGLRSWTPLPNSKGPSPRFWASMAYDAADGYVILVGGQISSGFPIEYINDTWKFQGGVWTNITSTAGYPGGSGAPIPLAYDASDGYLLAFGAGFWKFQGGVWTKISCTTATCPVGRYHSSMTYDAADQRIVLFGGSNASLTTNQGLSDTWEFHGGVWTKIVTIVQPPGREEPAMAYDAKDGYVVLFGGDNNNNPSGPGGYTIYGDTWKFVGGTWTNITGSVSPTPRTVSTMSYDSADRYVLLFGGNNFLTGDFGDTWELSGGVWTNIPTDLSPAPRSVAGSSYDDADRYVVLFGGNSNSVTLNDTWTWSAPAGFDYSLSNNGPVSIVAGSSGTVTITTSLTSGTTQPVTPSCVTPLPTGITCTSFSPASVTPSSTGATSTLTISVASSAAVGSHSLQVTGSPLGATTTATTLSVIVSASGQWTNITPGSSPPARYTASMIYDAADGYVVLFGGQKTPNLAGVLADTWKFSGGTWTNITSAGHPSPRYEPSMVYDSADGYVILFGGSGGIGGTCCYPIGDTWKFLGGSWTDITPGVSPSPRDGVSMVNDPTDGYVILFGGGTGGASVLSDTWKFVGGSWTNITPSSSPSPRRGASMSFDAADGYVALFGGVSSSYTFVSDTWKFVGGSWTNITSSSGPSSRFFAPMAFDVADNYVILFGGQRSNGAMLGDTWKFVSGSWTNITAGSGPSPRFEGAMAYDIADSYIVLFGGQAVNGAPLGDTWKFSASSGPPPFDYSLFNNSPVTIPAGTSGAVSITASLTGGTAQPVTLACAGLPAGITCGGFSPNPVTPTSGGSGSDLMINVDSSVAAGTYMFTATGSPVGATLSGASTTVTVIVPFVKDNTLTSVGSVSCTIQSGANSCNAAVTVIVTDTTAMSNVPGGTVTFTFMAGTTGGSLSSGSCILTAGTCSVTFTGAMAGTGSISAQYGGDASHSSSTSNVLIIHVTASTVPFDFSLSGPSMPSLTIDQGSISPSVAEEITATLTSGSSAPVTFSITSTLPNGVTAQFLTLPPGSTNCIPTCTEALGFSATLTATLGTVTVDIQATGGGVTRTTQMTLTVNVAYLVSVSTPSPSSLTVTQGSTSRPTMITLTVVSGSGRAVGLAVTNGLSVGDGITPNYSNDPCNPNCTVTISFSVSTTAILGTYDLTICCGTITGAQSTHLTLIVVSPTQPFDYSLSVNPTSASIVQGSATSATVTATLTSGTGQQVQMIVSSITPDPVVCQSTTSPCGSLSFSPASITPTALGATSTMTIMTTAMLPPGTYTVTIHGSPAGQSSSTATFTITVIEPSTSTVSCGHNESCGVVSNATLSNVKIAGNTLHIEADGTQGGHGYANVTVPKSEIPNIDDMHVFVDNNKLNSGVRITSNSSAYFIYFTFTFHSPVKIDIQLSAPQQTPNAPTILGIDQTLFYEIIGGIIGTIVIVSAVVVVARRRKTKPPA